jgi:hypothetical protein
MPLPPAHCCKPPTGSAADDRTIERHLPGVVRHIPRLEYRGVMPASDACRASDR